VSFGGGVGGPGRRAQREKIGSVEGVGQSKEGHSPSGGRGTEHNEHGVRGVVDLKKRRGKRVCPKDWISAGGSKEECKD